jgi:hypothetical protein
VGTTGDFFLGESRVVSSTLEEIVPLHTHAPIWPYLLGYLTDRPAPEGTHHFGETRTTREAPA